MKKNVNKNSKLKIRKQIKIFRYIKSKSISEIFDLISSLKNYLKAQDLSQEIIIPEGFRYLFS